MGGVFCCKDEKIGEFVSNTQDFHRTQGKSKKRKGLGGSQSRMGEDGHLESLVLGKC